MAIEKERGTQKYIMDLELLNTHNAQGCPACGHKFNLGDTVVMACGTWPGGAKLIHAHEAIFDPKTSSYLERRCTQSIRLDQTRGV